MHFNEHYNLKGKHAILSPSNYHWVNDDDDKLNARLDASYARERGTRLHEFAEQAIKLGIRLPRTHQTLNMFVNDAIGYHMSPERVLYYTERSFGTADAISFDQLKGFLRIHDLKTGKTPAKFVQLYLYAALFCLEYDVSPSDIGCELRIYQNDERLVEIPAPADIAFYIDKYIHDDQIAFEREQKAIYG